MSKTKFDELCNLTTGRFDWKIKVRIVRLWRGVTKKGEMFKGFSIILLDSKNNRMHAFVPANSVDRLKPKLTLGKIKDVEDDVKSIEHNAFDFYDHSELKELTKQNTYLADVVGIIKYYQPLSDLVNRLGNPQKQVKFTITDGRSSVNVTFWDSFAENFDKQMNQVSEKSVIVIIASSRVGLWNDEVDLSSVGGTICYLNYNHYSVSQLRKKLTQPAFSQQMYAMDKNREVEMLNVATIKSLGKDYIMRYVCAHLTIRSVDESKGWYSTVCTDCNQEIGLEEDNWFCHNCNRILPHPDKKFKVSAVAYDATCNIELILGDQQIRAVVEKRAVQLLKEMDEEETFPPEIMKLRQQKITVKIIIKEVNVNNNAPMYWATNICRGFVNPNNNKEENIQSTQQQTTQVKILLLYQILFHANSSFNFYFHKQASSSTYHLDGLSQLNFESPMNTKNNKE